MGRGVCVEKVQQGMGRGVEQRERVWRIYIRIWKNDEASEMKQENTGRKVRPNRRITGQKK